VSLSDDAVAVGLHRGVHIAEKNSARRAAVHDTGVAAADDGGANVPGALRWVPRIFGLEQPAAEASG